MIQSVERAIDILNEISRKGDWIGVREIARAVNLKAPTAQQLLKTLLSKGFLEFDNERRQYRLGLGLWALAEKVNPLSSLANLIEPHVDSLFHEFGETVVALALINNKSQVVLWRQSSHSLAVIAPDARGVIAAPHHLAGGRVVLAYAEQAFRELYLKTIHFPENGKNLFRNEEEFLAEMERIQNQGYAVTENVIDSGIGAMSAPIFFKNGDFAMSLACSMPLSRFGGERKKQILKSLLEISEKSRL